MPLVLSGGGGRDSLILLLFSLSSLWAADVDEDEDDGRLTYFVFTAYDVSPVIICARSGNKCFFLKQNCHMSGEKMLSSYSEKTHIESLAALIGKWLIND